MIHGFAFPTSIRFGPGARSEVARHLLANGCARPLVVTDRGLAALPVFERFLGELAQLATATFSGVAGNPVRGQVVGGVAAYKAHGADSIVGIGGGAALDVAKAIALMATHPGDILEYAWDHPQVRPINAPLPYFVALPTTAGTGSEVGRSSVISDDVTHEVLGEGVRRGSGSYVALGAPLANSTVYVLDDDLQPAPFGVPGELYLGGAGVGRACTTDTPDSGGTATGTSAKTPPGPARSEGTTTAPSTVSASTSPPITPRTIPLNSFPVDADRSPRELYRPAGLRP